MVKPTPKTKIKAHAAKTKASKDQSDQDLAQLFAMLSEGGDIDAGEDDSAE